MLISLNYQKKVNLNKFLCIYFIILCIKINKYSSDIIISIIKINKKMQINLKNYSLIYKNNIQKYQNTHVSKEKTNKQWHS